LVIIEDNSKIFGNKKKQEDDDNKKDKLVRKGSV